jgi:hypothetical protein
MPNHFCAQCGGRLEPNDRFCRSCGAAIAKDTAGSSPRRPAKRERPLPGPLILGAAGVAFLVLALFLNQANRATVAAVPDELDTSGLSFPEVGRISVAEARERLETSTAVIVDVRSAEEYAEAHIPNALSLPLNDFQSRYQELPPNREIITYCT